MKHLKSLLALLLVFATLFSFVACTPGTDSPGTSEEGTESQTTPEETTPQEETVVLYENNAWTMKIIRADQWSTSEYDAMAKIRDMIQDSEIGSAPRLDNDFKRDNEEYDSSTKEILFGYTGHNEMRELYKTLKFGEAEIKVSGNKILIASYTYEGFIVCRNHLEDLIKENYKDGKLEIKVSDLEMKKTVNELYNNIPVPEGADFSSVEDCGLDQILFLYKNATADTFKEYQTKLADWEVAIETEDNGNHFATYAVGENQVNVTYSAGDNKLRIILNKETAPTELFEKQEVKAVTTPMILMHGLGWEYDKNQNGLCLIIRNSEGKFIVVDGGFNREQDAVDLYNLLVKYTPTGMKPTVAAWFITHAHGDHHGTFANKFVGKYRNQVAIENVVFNPPSPGLNKTENNEGSGYVTILNVVNTIEGCNLIRCHTGDKYYIGDAEIDMLYTVDNQYPTTFTYYNTCSFIFSLKLGGQRIIITGDGANTSFDKVVDMYGESLKADILQVAHHGYGTGVSETASTAIVQAYKHISPTLVLWPIGEQGYESVKGKAYNAVLFSMPSVKEIVIAKASDHLFELPYTPPAS